MAPPILRHCEACMLIFSSARSSASSSVCVSVCLCVTFMNSFLKLNGVSQHSLWSLLGVSEVTWQYLNSLASLTLFLLSASSFTSLNSEHTSSNQRSTKYFVLFLLAIAVQCFGMVSKRNFVSFYLEQNRKNVLSKCFG